MIGKSVPICRHDAEDRLLRKAVEGDAKAADSALLYLSSANPSLRQIMQEALHDLDEPRAWWYLLRCVALHRWGDLGSTGEGESSLLPDCVRRSDQVASERIDESIVEVFAVDESAAEADAKERVLQEGMQDANPLVRSAAAYLAGMRRDRRAIPTLSEVICKGERNWQLRALRALTAIRLEECGESMIDALAMEDEAVHHAARRALSELGSLAVPALVHALGHNNSHVRWHAARGLGMVGDTRAVRQLAQGLSDNNRAVRWTTARVLARLDSAAVPAILEMLSRSKLSEPLREAAYHALHAMPSRQTQERLQPVLTALTGPAASVQAPQEAQRLLRTW